MLFFNNKKILFFIIKSEKQKDLKDLKNLAYDKNLPETPIWSLCGESL